MSIWNTLYSAPILCPPHILLWSLWRSRFSIHSLFPGLSFSPHASSLHSSIIFQILSRLILIKSPNRLHLFSPINQILLCWTFKLYLIYRFIVFSLLPSAITLPLWKIINKRQINNLFYSTKLRQVAKYITLKIYFYPLPFRVLKIPYLLFT